ncbi:L-threonylcarbamoyladenylate synthase [Bifidobacterium aquikefiricola]|uniref:L-threonylcarbamoyladenylate synthase n=1 Tax=Bifidobacterium aquikefiricola TaxID=3059038 RepID=A0AB39U8C7_9BIFI
MSEIRLIDEDSLALAARYIHEGKLIVMPTDTVYGIACDPFNEIAIEALFEAKHRPLSKSLQVLLADTSEIEALDLRLPYPLDVLSASLLPGAFSPICIASADTQLQTIKIEATARTQGIRVPDAESTRRILAATGPVAASSANISGQSSAQSVQDALAQLGESVALYLDDGPTPGPVASTVVTTSKTDADGIAILRQGVIPESQLRDVIHANQSMHQHSNGHRPDESNTSETSA